MTQNVLQTVMVNSLSLQWIHPAKPENNLKVEHLKCDHLLLFCVLYNFEYNIYIE